MGDNNQAAGQSILRTIRQMLGPDSDYDVFDTDLIVHINTVFMTLAQAGIGPKVPFQITGEAETWDDFGDAWHWTPFPESGETAVRNISLVPAMKTYIYLEVKNMFDPPESSSVQNAYSEKALEYLWRLNVQSETPLGPD